MSICLRRREFITLLGGAAGIITMIPIVSASVSRDIAFRRPGGNVTRCIRGFWRSGGKRIGLLHELLPRATTLAVLITLMPVWDSSGESR
jgi:hypothetical protein